MIYVILADGFEEIEALCPVDMLRRAKCDVHTVGLFGKTVTGSHGIPVVADMEIRDADFSKCEMLVLPGGMPGAKHLDGSAEVENALRTVYENGGRLAAICAAPMVLGHKGYLKGKEAICFPGFEGDLVGAKLSKKVCVTDGKITTGKGMEWALDFAKELVRVMQNG